MSVERGDRSYECEVVADRSGCKADGGLHCLSADGISLLQRVVRPPGIVDEQVASWVRRRASVPDVEALARSFAPRPSSVQR